MRQRPQRDTTLSHAAASQATSTRLPALDAARALGVVAMVCGHTLDALLAPEARAAPGVAAYWQYRGLTAPLFLTVSGWAVAAAAARAGASGRGVFTARVPRVLLLLCAGFALRFPAWDTGAFLKGDRALWRHFLAFDALHCVAFGLLAVAAALAAAERLRPRLALLAVGGGALLAAGSLLPSITATGIPEIAFEQILRGTSPFPALPWAVYVLAGCAIGLLAREARSPGVAAAGMAAAGALLVVAAHALGLEELAVESPVLVALRLGQVLLLLAALAAVPRGVARGVAPLGRASLFVYVVHVPVVYGWGTYQGLAQRLGPALDVGAALAVAAAVLAGSLAARGLATRGALAADAARAWAAWRLAALRAPAAE
jgi:uncharacterized membrane protein